jgi:hypothetical protein
MYRLSFAVMVCASLLAILHAQTTTMTPPPQMVCCGACLFIAPLVDKEAKDGIPLGKIGDDAYIKCVGTLDSPTPYSPDVCAFVTAQTIITGMADSFIYGYGTKYQACKDVSMCK